MPARLPENYKSLVIQQWLRGEQRDKIAVDNGLSAGSVTNIVNEYRMDLGFPRIDELRELTVTLKRIGITAAQCALGFRIASIMLRIGVREDSLESFILHVYNRCKDIGLSPEKIAFHLADLLEFSKTVPLSKIADYIKEKTNEKRELEEQIENLKMQIEVLQERKSHAESASDKALQDERMTSSGLKWYTDLRTELSKYGIPVDDISRLAKLADNIRQYDYDAEKVIDEFRDVDVLRLENEILQDSKASLEGAIRNLKDQRSGLEVFVNKHNQLLNIYQHLEVMGFGLKELQFLWNTVMEIARENNIPSKDVVKKFLSGFEYPYNNKGGFESKVGSSRNEVNKLNQEQATVPSGLLSLPSVEPNLLKLARSGVSEQDLEKLKSSKDDDIA